MKNLNKYICLLLLFIIAFKYLGAQELLQPLISNSNLKGKINIRKSTLQEPQKIKLPFWDDFSYASPSEKYPHSLWENNNSVYVNCNYGYLPISIGVATFDALNSAGTLYPNAANVSSFNADILTSCYIDLKGYKPQDSVYLSFFYQQGGFGEAPDISDTLFLQFRRASTNYWDTVWWINGGDTSLFKEVYIAVDKEVWLKDSFQFRFFNTASVNIKSNNPGKNTNGDIWNLDYVYMDQNRTKYDSIFKNEIAIIYPPQQSLLRNFESMPWSQFKLNYVFQKEKADSFVVPIWNYRDNALDVTFDFRFIDVWDRQYEMRSSLNTVGVDSKKVFYAQDIIEDLESDLSDSVLIEVKLNFQIDNSDSTINDSISYFQHFSDYFSYDDGTAEYGYGISGEGATGAMLAMRFQMYRPELLTGVRIFLNESLPSVGSSSDFYLTVWNEKNKIPGDTLFKKDINKLDSSVSFTFKGKNSWATFNLDTPIVVPSVFYVGWVQKSAYFANVGFDRNRLAAKHTYYNLQGTPGGWVRSSLDGALMIHPVIDTKAEITNKTSTGVQLKVYPNPASRILYFDLPEEFQNKKFRIEISSISGSYNLVNIQDKAELNISQLQAGVYLLKITSPDGNVTTTKFIKNAY